MDAILCFLLTLSGTFLLKSLWSDLASNLSLQYSAIAFILQYSTLKFYRICLYHRYLSPLRHVPGPKDGHWLLGQALNLLKAPTPTTLHLKWMRQFPDAPFIRYLSFFNTEVLVCNSLGACRAVLKTHCYSIRKSDWYMRSGKDILGKGLIAKEGDDHRSHRRLLSAPFSMANIRKLEPLFKEKARALSAVLHRAVEEGEDGGKTGVIDCNEIFSKSFLDVIGAATLGKELSQLETIGFGGNPRNGGIDAPKHEESPFHRAYTEFFAPPDKWKQLLTFISGFYPVRWLPFQANRDYKSAVQALQGSIIALIRERVTELRSKASDKRHTHENSRDLLTFIVEEHLLHGEAVAMNELSEEVLLGDLMEFIGAGHETSANTLSWALLVLAQNHGIQDKLRAEIGKLLTKNTDPSYTDVEKLPYLDNFIKEVLRVYPPANTLFRQTSSDLIIEGLFIPKNTLVDLCCAIPQQNPLIWGNDAHIVDPDRWDGLSDGDGRLNTYAFEAFSNGPRICLGKDFALLELKTMFVELVRRFKFLKVEKSFTLANPSLVLRPNGLEIRLELV